MKVMLVSPLPPPSGGIATWTQTYTRYSQRLGIELGVVNTAMSKKRAEKKTRRASPLDEMVRTWRILRDCRRMKRDFAPDIIHISSSCARFGLLRDALCMRVAKDTPVVLHCHCNIEDQTATKSSRWLFRRAARRARKVFVLNSSSQAFTETIAPGKTVLMPNFIETQSVCRDREIRDTLQDVVFVGHVKREKGIRELYLTAGLLPTSTFHVVGPVQDVPEDMKKPENVILSGEEEHDAVIARLRRADAFFFPSHTEGFSVAMLEAMAAGLPIVATDVGANRDMIGGEGGIVVPAGDVEAMHQAFLTLAPPEKRAAMSSWNRQRVCSAYAVEQVVADMKKIYEELLA